MNDAVLHAPDYDKLLTEAIDLREDGDYEDSVEKFEAIFDLFPNDPRIALEYANALMKLNRPDDADVILGRAAKGNPNQFHINKTWALHAAFVADSMKDHMNAIRRGRAFREAFPPRDYPEAWQSLAIEIDILYETGLFDDLEFVIDEYWDDFLITPEILPAGLQFLSKLFLNEKLLKLIHQSKQEAWTRLPPESRSNLTLRTELAVQVHRLVTETNTKVLSIGQNCFPYQVGGQWGLKGARAHISDLTFLDRAMFYHDTAAHTIETDFAEFYDVKNFEFVKGFGRCQMPRHKPTGATFYHDRATFFESKESSHFLDSVARRIENWRLMRKCGDQIIYVFSLCGGCDLEYLVDVADRLLLDEKSHLVIVNVLKNSSVCPSHPQVTYIHAPYPTDFDWGNIFSYSKSAGLAWEMTFIPEIISLLKRPLASLVSEKFELEQRATFTKVINKARSMNDIVGLQSLVTAQLLRFQNQTAETYEYVQLLLAGNKVSEADAILTNLVKTGEAGPEIYSEWIDLTLHTARWEETIERAFKLCTKFTPSIGNSYWSAVNHSLIAHYEAGLWQEAHDYILQYWSGFTDHPELFLTAIDFLTKHGYYKTLSNLLENSSLEAKQALPQNVLEGIAFRLNIASNVRQDVSNAAASVIPLGQNIMASLITSRWGLSSIRTDFYKITPFDICDFTSDSSLYAIETNFSTFLQQDQYKSVPVAVGGEIIEHKDSGAAFFLARRAEWNAQAWHNFHNHVGQAIENWKASKLWTGPQIYFHIISRPTNLERLIAAFDDHLSNEHAHLVIVDIQATGITAAARERVTYIHIPAPEGYDYNNMMRSSSQDAIAYEFEIIRPIISLLKKFN